MTTEIEERPVEACPAPVEPPIMTITYRSDRLGHLDNQSPHSRRIQLLGIHCVADNATPAYRVLGATATTRPSAPGQTKHRFGCAGADTLDWSPR
ncbi:hypothetical protein MAAFP003_2526 [Mycobacterium ahvazicum]|uniref:Uncharacterized protein n=1 Tax=Mycobacterium ahvazicum TaxID=1964395 RepID=A0A2K4YAN4_9MYCO|nr:hypothetical protein MAAFP003_2526 [Mycobacterium ahvazicum]